MCSDNNIHVVMVPKGCTSKAQPLDVGVNGQFKGKYRKLWQNWMKRQILRGGVGKIPPPRRDEVLKWVFECNNQIEPTSITRSFAETGIMPSESPLGLSSRAPKAVVEAELHQECYISDLFNSLVLDEGEIDIYEG